MRGAWCGVVLGALLAAAQPLRAQDEGDLGIALGAKPAPVQIQDLNGKPVDLGAYIGKGPVLLEFWATWCPICRALEPRLRAAYARYSSQVTFLIVGVAVNETPETIRRHVADHPLPGTVLWDVEGRAVRAFDAPQTSYVVMLDKNGKVAYTGAGSDQDIEGAVAKMLSR